MMTWRRLVFVPQQSDAIPTKATGSGAATVESHAYAHNSAAESWSYFVQSIIIKQVSVKDLLY